MPTKLKIGDIVEAMCIEKKVVRIKKHPYNIQLVINNLDNPYDLVNLKVKVKVKQISKVGKISQVEYIENC